MTRKDYERLAAAMVGEKPGATWCANKHTQWALDCQALARAFQADNDRFDAGRFYTACGFEDRHRP